MLISKYTDKYLCLGKLNEKCILPFKTAVLKNGVVLTA